MNIIEQEKRNIQSRIDDIIKEKQLAGMAGPTEIAAGIPVLQEHATEYKSLLRMQEIIDANMAQDGINEYLDKRSQTKLAPLPNDERETFINPMTLRFKERDIIVQRMREILSDAKYQSADKERANDGNWVNADPKILEEYNSLDAMKTIANRNFNTKSYYEYYALRSKTALGAPSDGRYQALMGKPAPAGEIKPSTAVNAESVHSFEAANNGTEEVQEKIEEVTSAPVEPDTIPKQVDEEQKPLEPPRNDEPDLMSGLSQREEEVEEQQPFEPPIEEPVQPNLNGTTPKAPDVIVLPASTEELQPDYTPKQEENHQETSAPTAPAIGESLIPIHEELIPVEPKLTKEELMIATIKEEQSKIQSRKNEIKSLYALAGFNVQSKTTSDGQIIQDQHYEEYESLIKMDNILKAGLNNQNKEEYLNLRATTTLGLMSLEKQDILTGSTIEIEEPNPIENPTAGNEEPPIEHPTEGQGPVPPIEPEPENPKPDEDPTKNPKNNPDHPEKEEEPLYEVVATKAWNWVKGHKKQILIGLGITAITIATVVALTQLVPAIYAMMQANAAATQASNIAGIAAEMVKNSQLHHLSVASEKVALHSANTALGNILSTLTKVPVNFNTSTYIWTVGSEALTDFVATSAASAATAAASAADAVAKVGFLSKASLITGVGGLGTLGAGLLMPMSKKSKEFLALKEEINALLANAQEKPLDEQNKAAQEISSKIIVSNTLTERERTILFKRLQKAISKTQKMSKQTIIDKKEQEPIKDEVKKLEAELVEGDALPFDITDDLKEVIDVNYTDATKTSKF